VLVSPNRRLRNRVLPLAGPPPRIPQHRDKERFVRRMLRFILMALGLALLVVGLVVCGCRPG